MSDIAIYRGDEFICLGTAEECAKFLDIKESSVRYMLTPTYRKRVENSKVARVEAIRIEDD